MESKNIKLLLYTVAVFFLFLPTIGYLGSISKSYSVVLETNPQSIVTAALVFISLIFFCSAISIVAIASQKQKSLVASCGMFFILLFIVMLLLLKTDISLSFLTATLLSLGLFFYLHTIFIEKENYVNLKFARLIPRNVKRFLLAVGIVISVTFYQSYTNSFIESDFGIPEEMLDKSVDGVINLMLKSLNSSLQNTLNQNSYDIGAPSINLDLPDNLKSRYGEVLQNSTPTVDPAGIKKEVKESIAKIIKPYKEYIPVILSLGVFFTAGTVFSIISIICAPVSLIMFKLLKNTGVITEYEKEEKVKKVTF